MLYYVSLIWSVTDPSKIAAAQAIIQRFRQKCPEWTNIIDTYGMFSSYLVTDGPTVDKAYVLPNKRGVIFGRLFERTYGGGMPKAVTFTMSDADRIIRSEGRILLKDYWGQYIAFLNNPQKQTSWVLRDPTGILPCYHTTILGIDLYFMRLEDSNKFEGAVRTINHDFIVGLLSGSFGFTRETGLNEVENLLAGECAMHSEVGVSRSFYWDPHDFSARAPIEDFDEAVRLVRHSVETCVAAWASCFDGILLRLSGGLDSSIVLAALMKCSTKPRIVCQTEFIEGTQADERRYARLAAERARCELLEENSGGRVDFTNLLGAPPAVSPHVRLFNRSSAEAMSGRLQRMGIAAVFEGHGGDEVFYKGDSIPSSVDYGWCHGLSPGLLRVVWDDAFRERLNFWSVLGNSIRFGKLKRPWPYSIGRTLSTLGSENLMRDARRRLTFTHPLFTSFPYSPPGKNWHAYTVSTHSAVVWPPDRIDTLPVSVSPLLSQPLMELCLQIATYTLCKGGKDRAVARAAFQDRLPAEVFHRTDKGTPESRAWELILENANIARELLLDGYLVRTGCLDGEKLERLLAGQPELGIGYAGEFLGYLNIESWARNWTGTALRVAA